jgi:NADP-dependent 3-hydroxy acid dehydrogenase YdfG
VSGPLHGRTALVTGASRGIGRAVLGALGAAGVRLLGVARGAEPLRAACAPAGALAVPGDVGTTEGVARVVAEVRAALGGGTPDIVVHAAGAFGLDRLADAAPEDFDRMVAVNLRAPFLLLRAFLPAMLQRAAGHFVSVGSIAGRVAFPGNGAYSASKFGLRGLHAVLDAEVRGTGVRATLVEPAATDTTLWHGVDRVRFPDLPPREAMLPAAAVADAVVWALTRPPEVDVRNVILERA